ncbi:MAG: sulfurtransferase-like selenium metabolism protein YedF [Desulfovibrio sp.]|jgi:selenium metabolism protein YedF|nr:sulfurtransferase-like selenium metabolism protein YedF [Desulfovibrio sp.]
MPNIILDCRKLDCPQPVVRVKELLTSSAPGHLDVLVDNTAAVENVSRFLTSQGYASSSEKQGNDWRISAHTGATPGRAQPVGRLGASEGGNTPPNTDTPVNASGTESPTLLMLTSPFIGTGDDLLGARLMKTFLGTAPEFDKTLWRVILLNGGVTLSTEESPVIDELRNLEKNGTDIFVCGTCLQHFNLQEKKAVGRTTNMLDIVTDMRLAGKIIRF